MECAASGRWSHVDRNDEREAFSDVCHTTGSPFDTLSRDQPPRVILHFDLDCFYAQVEMIRNPALRSLPLGIQQKYIIVTCNYIARDLGVCKLMSVKDAKEKCPQLLLVSGEDLTHYRETSYRVTELLEKYCAVVERLGLDENFMDVTQLVETKMKETTVCDVAIMGHTYNNQQLDPTCESHMRLALGSRIAAEIRASLSSQLGLTSCAGVGSSKLLAKLVCGTFKPNQQTTLLPEGSAHLMDNLAGVQAIPGIGHRTAQRLRALGLSSVQSLQQFPLVRLEAELGASVARRIHSLSLGIDCTAVTPTGPPQSLSDEDSFKKVSTEPEVVKKIRELLGSLLERMQRDGRSPRTFRLTIRRFSCTNKWFSRESRQCPVPPHLAQKISSGNSEALTPLVSIAMKLFHRLVDTRAPFHLTLINVCFSNLQSAYSNSSGTIESFLIKSSPTKPQIQLTPDCTNAEQCKNDLDPPPGVDPVVFKELPIYIQRELISGSAIEPSPQTLSPREDLPLAVTHSPHTSEKKACSTSSFGVTPPPGVDHQVFSELPPDLQKELVMEWKRKARKQKPDTPSAVARNSLLHYFKPS